MVFFSYFPTPPSDCLFVICYIQSTLAGQSRFLLSPALSNEEERAQRAKKVVSDSPGLVDFAIGLVNSVINLPNGQVIFFEEFE